MFPPQYSPFNAARSFAIRDRAKCPRRRARSFGEGVIKSRVNAVPRDDDRCIILKIQCHISPVMEINNFPYASALRMCTTLRGQVINFAICSLLRCQMYMKSLSRDRVQKFFDLAKIIFKSQCKSLQFASKRRRIFLDGTCRKADFAHFVRRADKGE